MIYQKITTVEQDAVTPMATANTQQKNGGVMIGYLYWQPETKQIQLHLAINASLVLNFPNSGQFPASEDHVEPWWLPANITQMAHEADETTMQKANLGIYFDEINSQFLIDGQLIAHRHLTDIEWSLLKYIYKNMGRPCSYRDIAQHVWHGCVDDSTISQRIYRLRRKLKKISPETKNAYIETVRSYVRGYMLIKPAL